MSRADEAWEALQSNLHEARKERDQLKEEASGLKKTRHEIQAQLRKFAPAVKRYDRTVEKIAQRQAGVMTSTTRSRIDIKPSQLAPFIFLGPLFRDEPNMPGRASK